MPRPPAQPSTMPKRFFRLNRLFPSLLLLSRAALAAPSPPCITDQPAGPTPTTADTPQPPASENLVLRKARALWEQNQLPSPKTLEEWLQNPSAERFPLPQPSVTPLSPRETARRAAAAHLRIGWVFQCNQCSNWHTSLAGGYAISPQTVATARHVLNPPERMKVDAGYLIAVRGEHEVLIISGILGADSVADAAVLSVKTTDLQPLPLSREVEVGDAVFCLSDPNGEKAYFSAGIVNRFAKDPGAKDSGPKSRRINVSTDWAPGSSGSAILDACGNAVGHVGSITAITSQPKAPPSHYMTLHWAVPALQVLHLAHPTGAAEK